MQNTVSNPGRIAQRDRVATYELISLLGKYAVEENIIGVSPALRGAARAGCAAGVHTHARPVLHARPAGRVLSYRAWPRYLIYAAIQLRCILASWA